jgi:hypothetical protein
MPLSRRALLLTGLAACTAARAQSIEVLDLRHRTAEEMLPLLQPLVEPGGALSGRGSQLFARTSGANLAQLRALLARLDRPPRQLEITVRQDRADEASQHTLRADGSVVVSSRRSSGTLGLEAGNGRSTATREATQVLRVLEGGRAEIAIGTAIPFTFKQYVLTAQGLTELPASTYVEAVTGFAVRPLLAGASSSVTTSPAAAAIGAQGIEHARLMTRVQGRLGEWIAVGGADLREEAQRGGSASSDARLSASRLGVWVRVDEVKPAR